MQVTSATAFHDVGLILMSSANLMAILNDSSFMRFRLSVM